MFLSTPIVEGQFIFSLDVENATTVIQRVIKFGKTINGRLSMPDPPRHNERS